MSGAGYRVSGVGYRVSGVGRRVQGGFVSCGDWGLSPRRGRLREAGEVHHAVIAHKLIAALVHLRIVPADLTPRHMSLKQCSNAMPEYGT